MPKRLKMSLPVIGLAGLTLFTTTPAMAYIGPGAGITMLSALWGVAVAIVLAIAAILFWPIRSLLRRRRKPATAKVNAATPTKQEGEH